ncbi:MAG: CFI-box-CTERM domain-containing protein [Bacteroidota bacterium]|nr:CFI-box-CTERM domain-containing protein [Bacteroidota bacterium]
MSIQDAYERGQRDGAAGKAYSEPNDRIIGFFVPGSDAENEAYEKGYNHGKGQSDGSHNEYDGDYSDSKKYNEGWDNGHESYSDNNSGCFITTATLLSLGKRDNCDELNTFRNFRDHWLAKQNDGPAMISEYYTVAPKIVMTIDERSDKEEIYFNLWETKIKPCLDLIGCKQYEEAKSIYCSTVIDLKNKYLK